VKHLGSRRSVTNVVVDGRSVEMVVLLDADGRACGCAPKATVHHRQTPLHLAFSCWLFDDRGRTLLTRRAREKRTWPGVWTNSFCGHPAPGEQVTDAVHRRARAELGVQVAEPRAQLPDFRYRAVMEDGTVENEICPVYVAELLEPPDPDPTEVSDLRWVPYGDLRAAVASHPAAYSPWMRDQLSALLKAGWAPTVGGNG
jgi:isopentenyl-diphosphate Delta-isomerase